MMYTTSVTMDAAQIARGTLTSDTSCVNDLSSTTDGTSYSYTYANGVARDETEIERAIRRLGELTKEREFKMPTKSPFDWNAIIMPTSIAPTIAKVETYNGKAVKVTFEDGTFEKAVCSDLDTFSVDVGITICVLKKMLGKDGHKKYNKMMRGVHKLMQKQVIEEAAERERKNREKMKAERAKEKAAKRKARAREDYIDAHVEALRRFNEKKQA